MDSVDKEEVLVTDHADHAEQKLIELRFATREANEVLAELKQTLKALQKERSVIERLILNGFDELIRDQVAESLKTYQVSVDQAIKNATDAVFARFDQLSALLLGETKDRKRRGQMSIPEMIQRKVDQDDKSS